MTAKKFKPTDVVQLISINRSRNEVSTNWIEQEPDRFMVGDLFVVREQSGEWLYLENTTYCHPITKFRKLSTL